MSDQSSKIVITDADLVNPVSTTVSTSTINPIDFKGSSSKWPLPLVVLALLTFIPFVNCWIWARHWSGMPNQRTKRIFVCAFAGAYSLIVAVGAGLYINTPRPSWLVRLGQVADYSVVKLRTPDAAGTGFVIASDGNRHLVLTNRHVISVQGGFFIFTLNSPADSCVVLLRSGQQLTGKLAALPKDVSIDLALILVESESLVPLGPIRRFENLNQGERVAAIGHPLGELDFSISDGIISAKRDGILVQTTTPINRGNSGGPLVDERGNVVAVNTWRIEGDGAQGLGFAIRADYVSRFEWAYSIDVSDLLTQLQL